MELGGIAKLCKEGIMNIERSGGEGAKWIKARILLGSYEAVSVMNTRHPGRYMR